MSRLAVLGLVIALAGCNTYRDQLARSQKHFEQSNYEPALGLLRDMENDLDRLTPAERAHYAYLRGMSDYRIGYRQDARHWLALARNYDEATPGVLPADWKVRLKEAIDEMNSVVYTEGLAALSDKLATDGETGPSKAPAKAKPAAQPSAPAPAPSSSPSPAPAPSPSPSATPAPSSAEPTIH